MDSMALAAIVVAVLLFGFLLSGMWVGLALASAGIFIFLFLIGDNQIAMLGRLQFNQANSFVLSAVPFFIFMGYVLINSGLSDMVYDSVTPLVSFIPGGLLHTNVVAGSVFGATCGTSTAGTAAVGALAIPQLRKRNYDKKLTYGSIAAGGTMSALIPPSLTFIVYGAMVNESVGKLFIAGILPGVLMTVLFMTYIATRAITNPAVAPKETVDKARLVRGLVGLLPVGLMVVLVLGAIYAGVATPTEAAAMGGVGALILAAGYKRLTWRVFKTTTLDTVKLTSMVMILVVGAIYFSMALSILRLPSMLTAWLVSLPFHRMTIFAFVIVFYIVLGMFMEGTAILLLSLPLTFPVAMSLGFDPVWFGVMVTVLIQVGLLTPPFGMDVFIVHKLSGDQDIVPAFRGAFPFMLLMLVTAVILMIWPDIATWLPSKMIG